MVCPGCCLDDTGHALLAGRIGRFTILMEPPSIDAGEITDKGYVNQRATLERRSALVDSLYSDDVPGHVVQL